MLSARTKFDGYDDGPPAPTLITVNGKTSFRHMVSNSGDVLAVLRTHKHVLAIGAHRHVGERVTLFNRRSVGEVRAESGDGGAGGGGGPLGVSGAGCEEHTVSDDRW